MLKISAVWRNGERKETRRQTRPNLSRVPPSTLKPLVRTRHLYSSDTHQADSAELEWNVSNRVRFAVVDGEKSGRTRTLHPENYF